MNFLFAQNLIFFCFTLENLQVFLCNFVDQSKKETFINFEWTETLFFLKALLIRWYFNIMAFLKGRQSINQFSWKIYRKLKCSKNVTFWKITNSFFLATCTSKICFYVSFGQSIFHLYLLKNELRFQMDRKIAPNLSFWQNLKYIQSWAIKVFLL